MKLRLTGTILLMLLFAALAVPSGAVPAAITMPTAAPPPPAVSDKPLSAPPPSPSPLPTAAAVPFYEPEDAPAPEAEAAEPGGTRVIATTIESDALLDNDTYYDIDPQALMEEGLSLSLPPEGYQVLIVHTHATEAYTQDPDDPYEQSDPYRTTDPEHSVIRVGEELAQALQEQGLNVLHCTTLFDYPGYNGAYVRSGEAIEEYMAAYPGIQIVIDLHRDALGDGDTIYKTVANIDGIYAAQMMFVMGSDVNLENPGWQEDLKLALTLQQAANMRYGTLMRPVELCNYRYNQQLAPGSLLLEVGTTGNTLAEALCAVRLFAETAGPVLASYIDG